MHEQSLVSALLAQVRQIAADHEADVVDEVVVEVGLLAGVEPLLMASAFERLATGTMFGKARLKIEQPALELRCRDCDWAFEVSDFALACPRCESGRTSVIRGDGLILRTVTLRTATPKSPEFEELPDSAGREATAPGTVARQPVPCEETQA